MCNYYTWSFESKIIITYAFSFLNFLQRISRIVSPCLVRISSLNHLDFALNSCALRLTDTANKKSQPVLGFFIGGEGGIRTPDSLSAIHDFESCAFDHSATSPWFGLPNTLCSNTQSRIYHGVCSPPHSADYRRGCKLSSIERAEEYPNFIPFATR